RDRAGRHRLQEQHGGHGQSRRLFQHRHLFFLPCMEIIGIYIVRLTPPTSRLKTTFFVDIGTFYW
ncbi:MAG: hypothetical protein ACLUMK_03945, partial [Christensenellales bacterium]